MKSNQENVVNSKQMEEAQFRKLFGNDETMYIPSSESVRSSFLRSHNDDFNVFIVPREKPLITERFLPEEVIKNPRFRLVAQPGEFFVFQVVVWTSESALADVSVSSPNMVCFCKPGNVRGEEVKIFWMGIQISETAEGELEEEIVVCTRNKGNRSIKIKIQVEGEVLMDGGESDENRMSRLRWLNSDIGRDDSVFEPYIPLVRNGRNITWLGHNLTLGINGLPIAINSSVLGQECHLLNGPITFGDESDEFQGKLSFGVETSSRIEWQCEGRIGKKYALLKGAIEFDGYLSFSITTVDKGSYQLNMDCVNTDYMVGLGRHGGKAPEHFDWFWDAHAWQDGCWLGNTEAGIRLRLKDSGYRQPLTNAYYHFMELRLPEAWHNGGKGGISLNKKRLTAFSGEIQDDRTLEYAFELQVTPFHEINAERHLRTHAWHPMIHTFEIGSCDPLEEMDLHKLKEEGVTRVNLHHGIAQNPFINYPISQLSLTKLDAFVKRAHEHGLEVLLYMTTRELSIHPAEFWAFRAMGDDIFQPGLGTEARPATNGSGPHEWLCNNLHSPFLPAWGETIKNGPACNNIDLALETVPESSRFENFFLESLRYLLEHCPIDGLYMDDTCLSREGFQRLHRVFRKYRGKAPIIDFHAWNPFRYTPTARDYGRCSVILRDMMILPYVTELWLGESYDYEITTPEYYLTEISGIPLGLMSQMLAGGGNQWRGILYGMTNRYGWIGKSPKYLWKFFEEFGLRGLKLELDVKFPGDLPDGIYVSRFSNAENKVCYALASWNEETVCISPETYKMTVPEITDFQFAGQRIIEPGKGLLLVTTELM